LTGQTLTFTDDELKAYTYLCHQLKADLRPQGELEERLVTNLADAQFRLERANAIEQNLFFELTRKRLPTGQPDASGHDDPSAGLLAGADWARAQARTFFENGKQFDLLSRYANRFHRQIIQLKATLDKSQETRRKREASEQLQQLRERTPLVAEHRRAAATPTNKATGSPNEFVSQEAMSKLFDSLKQEFEAAVPRQISTKKEAA